MFALEEGGEICEAAVIIARHGEREMRNGNCFKSQAENKATYVRSLLAAC